MTTQSAGQTFRYDIIYIKESNRSGSNGRRIWIGLNLFPHWLLSGFPSRRFLSSPRFPPFFLGQLSLSFAEDYINASETQSPLDPAVLVAEEMLIHAIGSDIEWLLTPEAQPLLTIVHTPSGEWVEPARDAWGALLHGRTPPVAGDHEPHWLPSVWIGFLSFERTTSYPRTRSGTAQKNVAKAVWRGIPVVRFSEDPDQLMSAYLVDSADMCLEMTGPMPGDVIAAVRRLREDEPRVRFMNEQALRLAPRRLHLARRPNQSADQYQQKLLDLLAREDIAQAGASVFALASRTVRAEPTLERLHGLDEAVNWGFSLREMLRAYQAAGAAVAEIDAGLPSKWADGLRQDHFRACAYSDLRRRLGIWLSFNLARERQRPPMGNVARNAHDLGAGEAASARHRVH
jgi:hypothetical protein